MRAVDAVERGRVASHALEALGGNLSRRQTFTVECRQGHHLATVYETSVGSVVVARNAFGPHVPGQPGEYGFPSLPSDEVGFVDLLWAHPSLGDELSAVCECGTQTLSRSQLIAHLDLGRRSVTIL